MHNMCRVIGIGENMMRIRKSSGTEISFMRQGVMVAIFMATCLHGAECSESICGVSSLAELFSPLAVLLLCVCVILAIALVKNVKHQKKIAAAAAAKTRFIASISHEIRTPLAAIVGFSDLLKDEAVDSETRRKYLDSISVSANALMKFVNDALDLSRIEANKMHISFAPTDFRKLGEESIGMFSYRADKKSIVLETKIEQMPTIFVDPLRVRQILFNLIGNALQHTEKGSIVLQADFDNGVDGFGTLSFRVVDTGSGMDESLRERLLQPTEAISKIRGSNIVDGDTGLGLTITKRLVECMGGGLLISSVVGRGSTFEVRIPHVKYSLNVEDMPVEALQGTEKSHAPSEVKSILFIDDVEMNLKVMSAIARRAGAEQIETATSGREALDKLAKMENIDLILTDLWMPGMSGLEIVEEIRKNPRLQGIPIIALTADVEAKSEIKANVFDDFMFKPVTFEKFQSMMRSIKRKTETSGAMSSDASDNA